MVDTARLTQMRAQQAATFDKTCVVSNPAVDVVDVAGGTTPGAPTTATASCRIAPPRGTDQRVAERLGVVVDAVLTVPYGTTVSQRATITSGGRSYEVTHINSEESRQTAVQVFCRSVRSDV